MAERRPPPLTVERVFEPTKREGDTTSKKSDHIMLVGGREGPAVSGRAARTGWDGRPSERWTEELGDGDTLQEARTQPVNLRISKPGLRAWRRGVMSVLDMEVVLLGIGQPGIRTIAPTEVELSVWVEDEGVYRLVGGQVTGVRVPIAGGSVLPPYSQDSAAYASAVGIIFQADKDSGLPPDRVKLPYSLIGRLRKIYRYKDKATYTRVSGTPSPARGAPTDKELYKKVAPLERRLKELQEDMETRLMLYPDKPLRHDVTLNTSIGLATAGRHFKTPVIQSTDPDEARVVDPASGKELERLDTRAAVNLYRTISARNRKMRDEDASGLTAVHDPLELLMRRRKKPKPKAVPPWWMP